MNKKLYVLVKEFDKSIVKIDEKSPNLYILIDYEIKYFFEKINKLNINKIHEYFSKYNDVDLEVPNSLTGYILNSLILLFFKENKNNVFMKNFLSEYVKEVPRVESEWRIICWLKLLFGWVKSPLVEIDSSLDEANGLKNSVEVISKFIENNQNSNFPLDIHRNQTLCANLSFVSKMVFSNLKKKGEKIYPNSSLTSPLPSKFEQQRNSEEENDTRKFLLPPFPSVELSSNLSEDFQFPPPPSFLNAESVLPPPPPPFLETPEKKSSIANGDVNSRKGLLDEIQSLRSEEGIAKFNFKKNVSPNLCTPATAKGDVDSRKGLLDEIQSLRSEEGIAKFNFRKMTLPKPSTLSKSCALEDNVQLLKNLMQDRRLATQYSSDESDKGAASDEEWNDSKDKLSVKLSLQVEKSVFTFGKDELAMLDRESDLKLMNKSSEVLSNIDSHKNVSENVVDSQISESKQSYLKTNLTLQKPNFFKFQPPASEIAKNNFMPSLMT